jgi:hypothetical protein
VHLIRKQNLVHLPGPGKSVVQPLRINENECAVYWPKAFAVMTPAMSATRETFGGRGKGKERNGEEERTMRRGESRGRHV